MTTSTTFDPTRIAALPVHGGIGQEMRLEGTQQPAGDAIRAKPAPKRLQAMKGLLVAQVIRDARTALDHAETALHTMDPRQKPAPPKLGQVAVIEGIRHEWTGKGWSPSPMLGDKLMKEGIEMEWTGKRWVPVGGYVTKATTTTTTKARLVTHADVMALLQIRDCS